MRFTSLLTTLALTASTAHAAMIVVHNNCNFTVWYTSVGSGDPPKPDDLPAGLWGTALQYHDGTGTAVKFTRTYDGIWANKPVLHFTYDYKKGESIYYGISTHNGFDFWGEKITLEGEEGKGAEEIVWDGVPGPDHTAAYLKGEIDLTFTLCADE